MYSSLIRGAKEEDTPTFRTVTSGRDLERTVREVYVREPPGLLTGSGHFHSWIPTSPIYL